METIEYEYRKHLIHFYCVPVMMSIIKWITGTCYCGLVWCLTYIDTYLSCNMPKWRKQLSNIFTLWKNEWGSISEKKYFLLLVYFSGYSIGLIRFSNKSCEFKNESKNICVENNRFEKYFWRNYRCRIFFFKFKKIYCTILLFDDILDLRYFLFRNNYLKKIVEFLD